MTDGRLPAPVPVPFSENRPVWTLTALAGSWAGQPMCACGEDHDLDCWGRGPDGLPPAA